jgi:hypothetical protein
VDANVALVEVDGVTLESECLTRSQPNGKHQEVGRSQTLPCGRGEQQVGLFQRQRPTNGPWTGRCVGEGSDIAGHQVAAHGLVKRHHQDASETRERVACSARGGPFIQKAIHVIGRELRQSSMAKCRY